MKRNTFYLLVHYVVLSTLPSHDQGRKADYTICCYVTHLWPYTDKVRFEIKATVLIISLGKKYKKLVQHKTVFFCLPSGVKKIVWLQATTCIVLVSNPLSYHACKTSIINTLLQWRDGGLSLGMEVWEWEFGNAADRCYVWVLEVRAFDIWQELQIPQSMAASSSPLILQAAYLTKEW